MADHSMVDLFFWYQIKDFVEKNTDKLPYKSLISKTFLKNNLFIFYQDKNSNYNETIVLNQFTVIVTRLSKHDRWHKSDDIPIWPLMNRYLALKTIHSDGSSLRRQKISLHINRRLIFDVNALANHKSNRD